MTQTASTDDVQTATLSTEAGTLVSGETVTAEEGATIVQAEDGKQLVSIGDGQYVELPEGYTLIQTDEGYIIGQPGATFVQVSCYSASIQWIFQYFACFIAHEAILV